MQYATIKAWLYYAFSYVQHQSSLYETQNINILLKYQFYRPSCAVVLEMLTVFTIWQDATIIILKCSASCILVRILDHLRRKYVPLQHNWQECIHGGPITKPYISKIPYFCSHDRYSHTFYFTNHSRKDNKRHF